MHYEKLSNITERYPIVYNNSYNEAVHNVKICSMEFNVEGMISEFERFLGAWHSLRRPLDKNKMKDVWVKEISLARYATNNRSLISKHLVSSSLETTILMMPSRTLKPVEGLF